MKKSELNKLIEQRVQDRIDKEWETLVNFLANHDIACNLVLLKGRGKKTERISLVHDGYNSMYSDRGIINRSQRPQVSSNIKEVLDDLKASYSREETRNILRSLDSIKYLVDSQR